MATFTPVTDIWTPGYDQFYRPCWQNKKTRDLYYEPSRQVPAQLYMSFGYAADPNLPTGPDFTAAVGSLLQKFPLQQAILPPSNGLAQGRENGAVGSFIPAADMWTYGFDHFNRPCWLNKKTRKLHYDSVEGEPPAQPSRLLFTPTGTSPQSDSYVLPALASRVEDLPPPAGGKKRADEEGQWYLQRNEKGEKYYLNTTTWQWQYETPDCLKKPARGK